MAEQRQFFGQLMGAPEAHGVSLAAGAFDWQIGAACADVPDPDMFFPAQGQSTHEAKLICLGCPIQRACREYAVPLAELEGVWGGTSPEDRRRLRAGRTVVQVRLKPCGTPAAYNRHKDRGEAPCYACVDAHRDYRAARRRAAGIQERRLA